MFVPFPHAAVIASTLAMAKRRPGAVTAPAAEHSVQVYNLDDIDTPYPRIGSPRLCVTYADGTQSFVTTNHTLESFKSLYMNALIRQSYYGKDLSAPILRISDITIQ